jgi:hypothetical protein
LEEDFKRSLTQIIQRHQRAVTHGDDQIKAQRKKLQEIEEKQDESKHKASKLRLLTPTDNEAIDAMGALAGQGMSTPTDNETIHALGALADQFDGDGRPGTTARQDSSRQDYLKCLDSIERSQRLWSFRERNWW